MPKVIVKLNLSENSIEGKYTPGDDVLIVCDATDGDFTVVMPDAQSDRDTIFRWNKKDTSLNVVTLQPKAGQEIMGEDCQELTEEGDLLILTSDGEGWW